MNITDISKFKTHICYISMLVLLIVATITSPAFAEDFLEVGDFARGGKVWSDNCTRCHNMRQPTDMGDGLTSIFHMRVRANLTGQETRDIITFLKGVSAKPVVLVSRQAIIETTVMETTVMKTPLITSGESVYSKNCVACHGSDGTGNLPGVPNFTKTNGRLSKANNELLGNIINGYQSPNSLLPMPPRGGNAQLTDAELNAALTYIKAMFSVSR